MGRLAGLLFAVLAGTAPWTSAAAATAGRHSCSLSRTDKAWLDRAVAAWNFTARNITHIRLPPRFDARIFDAHCLLSSSTALAGGPDRWTARPHGAQIVLPDGKRIPSGVTSFASSDGRKGYFVMSTPSVWRSGKVKGGPLGLRTLMIAVLIHEGSHVAQIPTYGAEMEALSKRYHLPDSFNDDSIQEKFEGNPAFAASVERETGLLLDAARASDPVRARRFAREARTLMRVREARWFTGPNAYLLPAEDIWLTMEGSGQWAGYAWLADPGGGGYAPAVAQAGFGTHGKWWSQNEGFALFLALDRLTGGKWKEHAFGDGAMTGLQMLDAALST